MSNGPHDFQRQAWGRYVLMGELGRGGMGAVYQAYDPALQRNVAIKILHAARAANERAVERFRREARAAARLEHAGIVGLHEVGDHQGSLYIVMELVEGETLAALRERAPPDPREAARITRELALALEHAHSRGIVHRDVKPQNVIMTPDGRPRLLDFGLARDANDSAELTNTGEVIGTLLYMAPEQVRAKPGTIGPWTDIYSLGAVLYELIFGHTPFEGESSTEVMVKVMQKELSRDGASSGGAPAGLVAIAAQCLQKDRARRYASAAELAADIDRWLAGQTPKAVAEAAATGDAPPPPSSGRARALTASARARVRKSDRTTATGPRSGRVGKSSTRLTKSGRITRSSSRIPAEAVAARGRPQGALAAGALFGGALVLLLATVALGGRREAAPDAGTPAPVASDTGPPAVRATAATIDRPEEGALLATAAVAVAGSVEPADADAVWVDGERVAVSGGRFATETRAGEGRHEIVVAPSAAEPPLATRVVVVDTRAPTVRITAPAPGDIVTAETVQVTGRLEDAHPAAIVAGGGTLEVGEDGAFSFEAKLAADGEIDVDVVGRDRAGNEGRGRVTVKRDTTPPRIEPSPPTEAVTRQDSVVVRGRVIDASPGPVRVDGAPVLPDADGRFEAPVALTRDGPRVVRIEAEDAAGHAAEPVTLTVVRDATAPTIAIAAPADATTTTAERIEVSGRIEDASEIVEVLLAGEPTRVEADGRFAAEVALADGANRIEVTATDAAGNFASARVSVTRDAAGPTVALDPPLPADAYGNAGRTLLVAGELGEDGCAITVNGEAAKVTGRRFEAKLRLEAGYNQVEVVARDAAGNSRRILGGVTWHRRRPRQAAPGSEPTGGGAKARALWWRPAPEQVAYARKSKQPPFFTNAAGMRFALVPPGSFNMGSIQGRSEGETPHEVTLTRGFYVSATEVTNAQFRRFRAEHRSGEDHGMDLGGDDQPVVRVSWLDARDFCDWLSRQEGQLGLYRLPTEAEWEYAAEAGARSTYPWGSDRGDAAKHANLGDAVTVKQFGLDSEDGEVFPLDDGHRVSAPVGSFLPNRWGLFDMIGNAREWVADRKGKYPKTPVTDPTGPEKGGRLARGGGFLASTWGARTTLRGDGMDEDERGAAIGFRIVAVRAAPAEEDD